jgi:hypothetical protein
MSRLLKEPLLHFLVLGALLFGAYAWLDRGGQIGPTARQVRIGEADVAWLTTTWTRQWQREPTRDELRGLVVDYLKEELLAREAREMRLDENDTVVRRRLAQKLEFIVQDVSRLADPTDVELRSFHAAHSERFQTDPQASFKQIYLSRAPAMQQQMLRRRSRLSEAEANTPQMGDRCWSIQVPA